MPPGQHGFTPQDLGAYGVGLAVTVVTAFLTAPIIPIPFNLLISLGLGGTAWYGAQKVLSPFTVAEQEEKVTSREYKAMLDEMAQIATRTAAMGRRGRIGTDVSKRLASIARMIEMIVERYQTRQEFAGASKSLMLLQKFDEITAHYSQVKSGELFIDKSRAEAEIAETEGRVFPMVEQALDELGRKIDRGTSMETDIHKGTLEDMLRSLDLVRSLRHEKALPAGKEASHDA